MAGDVFDAGTVVAEARLERDQIKRDIDQLRRDLAKFERDARITIRPEFDPKEVQAGVGQARTWLKSLHEFKAKPQVELQDRKAKGDAAALRAALRMLGREKAKPSVEVTGIAKARAELGALRAELSSSWDKSTSGVKGLVGMMPALIAGIGAFSAGSYAAAAALQIAGTASMALLILPGILAAGAGVAATLKIGVQGVGDAMKAAASGDAAALDEALKKLAPSARAFVLETQRLRPAWQALQLDVQQRLFAGLAGTMGTLAAAYLPMLRTQLGGIATSLNQTAVATGAWLAQSAQVNSVRMVLSNTRAAADNLRPAITAIVQIFLDLAAVGSTFLPGLATGFSNAATRAAEFVRHARETGQLGLWIQSGLDTLANLGRTIVNVFTLIQGVIRAVRGDGEGMAASLAAITARWSAWVNSAAGQQALIQFFTAARAVAAELGPLIGKIAVAAGQMVMAVISGLPPLIAGLAAVFANAGPLLGVFAQLALVILPAVGAGLSLLAPILGPLLVILLATITAFKIYSTTVALISTVTRAWAVAQAILNGAMLLNPIGLIVVAVLALAAALVFAWQNSETFRNIVIAAWVGIQTAVAFAWSILQVIFAAIVAAVTWLTTLFTGWGMAVVGAWNLVRDSIIAAWMIVDATVFQPLIAILQGALAIATWFFRDQAIVAWNMVSGAVVAAGAAILGALNELVGFLVGVVVGAFNSARDGAIGAWNGLLGGIVSVWGAIRDTVFNPMAQFVTGTIPNAFRTAASAIAAAWGAVKEACAAPIRFVVNVVYNNGIRPAWNFIAGLVGLGQLGAVSFATGGIVPGYAPGMDRVAAMLSPGEGVVRPEVTRALGPAWIKQINLVAQRGGVGGVERFLQGPQRFQAGGAVPPAPPAGGIDLIGQLLGLWSKVTGALGQAGQFAGTLWGQGAVSLIRTLVERAWAFLFEKATAWMVANVPTDPGATVTAPGIGATFDGGGVLRPGNTLVRNSTGRPELAGRPDQWATLIDSQRVNQHSDGAAATNLDSRTLALMAGTMSEIRDLLERRGASATVNVYDQSGDPVQAGRASALAIRMS